MARRLTLLDDDEFAAVCARIDAGSTDRGDLRAATKHTLALLQRKAPGTSVEVRVPPFAAAQVIEGQHHTRGNPPAVVETDPQTWIALARGRMSWVDAKVKASGERSDLSALLPLTDV
ncbi:sterol carrier family protein [Aeromicrobium sp.]|uniref:sterol carrier family protein n=1 Tax=Aeromicrobium sp. TaxID=1871063 RepID=UPI003D6B00B7